VSGLVTIGARTYLGTGAIVRDRMTIGMGCVIGAGAVVTKDLPDRVLAMGVPARVVETNIEGK
jgi:acetyltransferase-like isoleucine patch superfamily enzyme